MVRNAAIFHDSSHGPGAKRPNSRGFGGESPQRFSIVAEGFELVSQFANSTSNRLGSPAVLASTGSNLLKFQVRTGSRGSNRLPEACPKVVPRHKHRNVHEKGRRQSCGALDRCILHRISVRTTFLCVVIVIVGVVGVLSARPDTTNIMHSIICPGSRPKGTTH